MNLELLQKNRFGFHELVEKPSAEELRSYYEKKYFQESRATYQHAYSPQELHYGRNKLEQKYAALSELLGNEERELSFLDVGAGEGWALGFFKEKGWQCTGLDFSEAGCQTHNPSCVSNLTIGDIYQSVRTLQQEKQRFDVILLDNVLEHVLVPLELLAVLRSLIRPKGVLIIEVPNDCSVLQEHLLDHGYISRPFWIVAPDHISYFNHHGLRAICEEAGWECRDLMGDFPIDLNLFNSLTNYVEDRNVGRSCHQARVAIENLLHALSPEHTNTLYRVLGEIGLGRAVIGFFQAKEDTVEHGKN